MFKSISNKTIYDNSQLSFIFEFFTPLSKREASAKFARALGRRVKWFTDANDSFEPTFETFKVAPVYSNGYKEITISTGFMPYQESVHMFLKIMNVIESIGYTTDRCSVKTRIRLDESELQLPAKVHALNKFKYLLSLDESKIFESWEPKNNENRKVYQNHIQLIQPRDIYNTIINESYVEKMNPFDFIFPESEFFATDFSELARGQLVVKYISGKDYTKKKKESIDMINYVIEHLYKTLSENYVYSPSEKSKITKIVQEFKESVQSTKSYLKLKQKYPEIYLSVDLKEDKFKIDSNYQMIREKLFKLIVSGGVSEAQINYDTDRRAIQIKDAKITRSILIEGVEFYNCEIEADAKNCLFNNCTITNSKLSESTIYSNNFITNSKLIDCDYLAGGNEIKKSYLDNSPNKLINASLAECLVNRGKFSIDSTIDSNTKIIHKL